jgi:hypothetical protein
MLRARLARHDELIDRPPRGRRCRTTPGHHGARRVSGMHRQGQRVRMTSSALRWRSRTLAECETPNPRWLCRRWRVRVELALWTAACGQVAVMCYRGGRTAAATRDDLVDQPTWVATRAITFAPLLTTSGRGSFRWATVAPAITATFRGGEIRKVIVVEPPVPM